MEAEHGLEIPLHKPKIDMFGFHDYACPTCHQNHAVMDCQTENFAPCWECQKIGWRIIKLPKFLLWLFT